MPEAENITVLIPAWVNDLEDDASRRSLEDFFTTWAFALHALSLGHAEAGVEKVCRQLLEEAGRALPRTEDFADPESACRRVVEAERLASSALSMARGGGGVAEGHPRGASHRTRAS